MKREQAVQVNWKEKHRTLTLEGEPVLEYVLYWPEVAGGGLGGAWITRYYARLARSWQRRWDREVYWKACLELGQRRQNARPFTPWQGELRGEVTRLEAGVLSLRFTGWETRGDGRPNRVRWGDVWNVRQGAPCPLKQWLGKERDWKRRIWKKIVAQGERRREGGDLFLDRDWERQARASRPWEDYCLTPEGIEVSLPQGTGAPMAEGCPVFLLELETEKKE